MKETLKERLKSKIDDFKKAKQESILAAKRFSKNKEYSEAALCQAVEETLTAIINKLEELLK